MIPTNAESLWLGSAQANDNGAGKSFESSRVSTQHASSQDNPESVQRQRQAMALTLHSIYVPRTLRVRREVYAACAGAYNMTHLPNTQKHQSKGMFSHKTNSKSTGIK